MSKLKISLFVVALAILSLPLGTISAGQQKSKDSLITRSSRASYQVKCKPSSMPIPLNELFNLNVTVFKNSSPTEALKDVTLSVDAAMPEHNHGMMVEPKITMKDDGSFTVEGMQFHMPGRWELYLDVTREGITERALYTLEIE